QGVLPVLGPDRLEGGKRVARDQRGTLLGGRISDQTGSSGFFGSSGRKKRTSFLSCLTSLKAFAREPTSLAMRFNSSSKTSHSRFAKISGRIYSLYFGASCAPRIEHAASQIQDSRDLSLLPLFAIN